MTPSKLKQNKGGLREQSIQSSLFRNRCWCLREVLTRPERIPTMEEGWVFQFCFCAGLGVVGIAILFIKDWMHKRARKGVPVVGPAVIRAAVTMFAAGAVMVILLTVFVCFSHSSTGNQRAHYTRLLIQCLGMGINRYYGTYRMFPSEPLMTNTSRSTNIYRFLCPAGGAPLVDLDNTETRALGGNYWVVDSWGNPIVYYARSARAAAVGDFILLSPGENGVEGDADDIVLTKVKY